MVVIPFLARLLYVMNTASTVWRGLHSLSPSESDCIEVEDGGEESAPGNSSGSLPDELAIYYYMVSLSIRLSIKINQSDLSCNLFVSFTSMAYGFSINGSFYTKCLLAAPSRGISLSAVM